MHAAPGGLRRSPREAFLLTYVPVVLDVYRALKPRLWPIVQVLVAHADHAGRCWPGVRRIGELTGVPKSTVARYLLALERDGHIARQWRRGKGCIYTIAARFLPAARLSHKRVPAVPPARAEEHDVKKTRSPSRFVKQESYADSPDLPSMPPWEQRLRGFMRKGLWLPAWGAKPTEAGCLVPLAILQAAMNASG
jgi:hypothetical protein